MQEYFGQFPQENGSIFLFNAYTGEAIYDVDRWGSPLPDAHKLSHWFEPTAIVPPLNIEDSSSSSRVHISDVSFIEHHTSYNRPVEGIDCMCDQSGTQAAPSMIPLESNFRAGRSAT